MDKIVLLDDIATLAAFLSIVIILLRWKKGRDLPLQIMLLTLVILFTIFGTFLFIEWSGYSHHFDPIEDLIGAIIPIIWINIFYIILNKQHTIKLKESEENLTLAIEGAKLGTWDWNIQTGYILINRRWAEIIGYQPEEISPDYRTWKSLIHPDDFPIVESSLEDHFNKTTPYYDAEFRMKHKDGSWKWISSRGMMVETDRDDRPLRAVGIHLDITVTKNMEQQLRNSNEKYLAANKELTESLAHIRDINAELEVAKEKAEENDRLKTAFLGNMSHEIRTPLNGILGFLELLRTPSLEENKKIEYMAIIEDSGKRLMNIIDDLLDISKIEKGQVFLNKETINPAQIIAKIADMYESKASQKGLKISTIKDSTAEGFTFKADFHKLMRILNNLTGNAIKFTHQGGIQLGYMTTDEGLKFFVKDTGIGIPPEMQKVIFERFRQVDTSLSRGYEGSGLGLSISEALVKLHGAELKVESAPGRGSTFYFVLPYEYRKSEQPMQVKEAITKQAIDSSKKILIAEDDEISFLFLQELLKDQNLTILHAFNGEEAVAMTDSQDNIGLILMDIKMPKMNGLEATRKIKAKHPGIPIIAQTAYALINDKEIVKEAGCDDYITKPILPDTLNKLILQYLK
ncbi:MAG: PAS domain-containing protein [Bacteroidales bacterium]|nr:PAS domain-containing protein [Bacteroidales bacterium]